MSSKLLNQVAEGFRLSPQQKRVWRVSEVHPSSAFGCQCAVWLNGSLDRGRLEHAIASVAAQHEILRTGFAFLEGTSVPVQVLEESACGLHDAAVLSGGNEAEPHQKVERFLKQQWNYLREPGPAPAFRFALATLADSQHVLVITASSLCADVITLINLVRLVQAAYGDPSLAESEALQYADLSEWQNQLLESADQDHTPYWKTSEFSDLAFPRLPFELRREHDSSEFTSEMMRAALPDETTAALNDLAQRYDVPLRAILLSAWQMVLHRVSGMDRFLLGIALDGRVQPELRLSLGPFMKFLPQAAYLDDNPRFEELLQQVNTSLEMARYDQLSFDFEPFGISDPSQRRRLFPILFNCRELPPAEMAGPLSWAIKTIHECVEPFELALTAIIEGRSLHFEFAWEAPVFAPADIKLLADSYLALLDEIAENPVRRIGEFTMVSSSGLGSVAAVPAVEGQTWSAIHEIIEGHALRTPNQPAVVCGDDRITYAELDRRASSLAHRLEQVGATNDSVVGLVAERSVDFIVGILAVLKAGAAWLPIEPDTPPARIQYMVEQASAVALLIQRAFSSAVSDLPLPLVYLDEHAQTQASQLRKRRPVHPCQRAYVIFTSGSTGQPKGVAIEHRHIAAYVRGLADRVNLNACSNFAVVSTLAADLGHTAVFGALTSGGCLHVISSLLTLNADALAQYFVDHSVDFVKIVPSHLEVLCRSFPKSVSLAWRYLFVGGELLTWNLVEMAQQFAPTCTVVNHYGPTETTVGVLCGLAGNAWLEFQGHGVPIGRPFAGTSAYLLDGQLQPVPVWMPGELYIGGDSVGRGYVGRGDLTAERFLPDPFRSEPGARMYRTGDLARYRSDGRVEFLGRRDGQVKIRGYRVELGEIEAALRRHPDVQKAAVLITDGKSSEKHLVAWAEVGSAKLTSGELSRFLEQNLPSYMVPKIVVCVDHLKLTSNGKIDRQSLRNATPPAASKEFCGPADEVEETLTAVWRSVLGVERIGVDDNYFALGGDSLRVIQLVHEARRYGIQIAATDILRHPTIRQLRHEMRARSLRRLFPDGVPPLNLPASETLPAAVASDVTDFYPITGIQQFMLNHYRPGIFHIQDCFYISDATFSYKALELAFQSVMQRHPALRTVFDLQNDPPMQWVRSNLSCNITRDDISHLDTSAQEDYIAAALRVDRERLFDPSDREAPLFRVSVYQRSTTEFNLVFSCHHTIMDGWGHRVFLNQLVQAYLSFKSGAKPDLGAPDSNCREFVTFQEAVRQSEKAAAFWQQYLHEVNPVALPSSASQEQTGFDDASLLRPLTQELVTALQGAAANHAVSMQALMLSAWFETLRALTGQQLAVSGVVANGRSEYLSDPLSAVGLFWNIVPVVSRRTLPLINQATEVQKDLVEAEPYSAYPITQLLADQGGRELFFSTFRYLNFWNTQQVPTHSDLRVIDVRSYDRYSFPLNCSAVVDPAGNGGYLQLDYDPKFFITNRVHAALDHYSALLEKIASGQAA